MAICSKLWSWLFVYDLYISSKEETKVKTLGFKSDRQREAYTGPFHFQVKLNNNLNTSDRKESVFNFQFASTFFLIVLNFILISYFLKKTALKIMHCYTEKNMNNSRSSTTSLKYIYSLPPSLLYLFHMTRRSSGKPLWFKGKGFSVFYNYLLIHQLIRLQNLAFAIAEEIFN